MSIALHHFLPSVRSIRLGLWLGTGRCVGTTGYWGGDALLADCPSLTSLDLLWCEFLTPNEIFSTVTACPNLKCTGFLWRVSLCYGVCSERIGGDWWIGLRLRDTCLTADHMEQLSQCAPHVETLLLGLDDIPALFSVRYCSLAAVDDTHGSCA